MQGVDDDDLVINLLPGQLGVLLSFQPPTKGYVRDEVVLSCFRQSLLHVLTTINNEESEEEVNKFTNILLFMPFMF